MFKIGSPVKFIETVKNSITTLPRYAQNCIFSPIKDTVEFSKKGWRIFVPGLSKKISPKNFLGGGSEANVYAINSEYVLRMYGGQTKIDSEFFPVEDIFEGRNFGQAVAKTKNNISINKRVPGVPLYKCNDFNSETYLRNLRRHAKISDEALEEYVADIAFINSKGWRIDQGNPENFLFDSSTGRIGIIDICEQNSSSLDLHEPYGHDWVLAPLVNSHDIFTVYEKLTIEERKEVFAIIKGLMQRVMPLCEKYDIPISKWNEDDYPFDSLINLLDLMDEIDVSKNDTLLGPIIYARYPVHIKMFEAYMANK